MHATKKIYDSIHRFIHLEPIESQLIHSFPFHRLRYIHQLGVAFLVYPGATHRRFEHSLGVMELATRIFDKVTLKGSFPHLLSHRKKALCHFILSPQSEEYHYWRKILRLAALCHDLGHLPFSHAAEKEILGERGHEIQTAKIIESTYLDPIWKQLEKTYLNHDVKRDVVKTALGPKKFAKTYPDAPAFSPLEKVISEIITGDFFGADRIDYLLRDSQSTGLTYGLFDYYQLLEMLRLVPSHADSDQLVLGVEENGLESCEALLLARHYMYKRLYQYPTIKSYAFHMARFMTAHFYDIGDHLDLYLSISDNEVLAKINSVSLDPSCPGHFDAMSLSFRKGRFQAIPLREDIQESDLEKLSLSLSIPPGQIVWKLSNFRGQKKGLDFPVLRKEGRIQKGSDLSDLSIPSGKKNWLYIASQYEKDVRKQLQSEDALK